MSNFYTNVLQWGNNILLREVKNGERVNTRIKYAPTLFAPVEKPTKFKPLQGGYATPVKFDSIKEAKEWIQMNSSQPDLV